MLNFSDSNAMKLHSSKYFYEIHKRSHYWIILPENVITPGQVYKKEIHFLKKKRLNSRKPFKLSHNTKSDRILRFHENCKVVVSAIKLIEAQMCPKKLLWQLSLMKTINIQSFSFYVGFVNHSIESPNT